MTENNNTRILVILHLAVFLAGWTGIFGRLISLGGLPLVWYRMMVSVVVLAVVMALNPGFQCFYRRGLRGYFLFLYNPVPSAD